MTSLLITPSIILPEKLPSLVKTFRIMKIIVTRTAYIFLLLSHVGVFAYSQNLKCIYPIRFPIRDKLTIISFNPDEIKRDSIIRKVISGSTYEIEFCNCEGKANLTKFDPEGRKEIKYIYESGLQMLIRHAKSFDPETFHEKIKLENYFEGICTNVIKFNSDGTIRSDEAVDIEIIRPPK